MRVLHINAAYWPFVGGAETYLQAMSERLVLDGSEVVVATTDAADVQAFWHPNQPRLGVGSAQVNGVQVVRSRVGHLPLSPWSFYLLRRLATDLARLPFDTRLVLDRLAPWMPRVPGLERVLDRLPQGFDLVHGVNVSLEWPVLAGWRYARRRGIPFLATPFVHVGERAVQRYYTMPHQLAVLKDSDRVLVQTGIERRELERLGVRSERIVCLGMGIDLAQTRGGNGSRYRAQHGIDGPLVTFMGAVTNDKGVVHLLQAMQRLWASGGNGNSSESADYTCAGAGNAFLTIAGPTVKPSGFEAAYGNLPEVHRRRVRRMGVVQGQLKQDMLAATDVFVLPSRVDAFGIAYLEAWGYGVPVIGCRAGGVPDVIDEGRDGLLVPFGDTQALAAAICALLEAPQRRREMGREGRAKVESNYTWDRIYERLRRVYAGLVSRD